MTKEERRLEYEGDRLLRKAGVLKKEYGIYRECDLVRHTAREILLGEDIPFVEPAVFFTEPKVTLAEMVEIAGLTAKQKQACRLMHRLGKQALVAEQMGISRAAVSYLLHRAYLRIEKVRPLYEAEEPSDWGWRLFYDELRYKERITYRKRTHPLDSSFHARKYFKPPLQRR